jgi:hypothetical protein
VRELLFRWLSFLNAVFFWVDEFAQPKRDGREHRHVEGGEHGQAEEG